jgi:hypothetical protein
MEHCCPPKHHLETVTGLPWIDIYSWRRHGRIGDAIRQVESYFRIVKPLIAISFGKRVSSIISSSFENYVKYDNSKRFLPKVGVLQIVNFGTNTDQTTILLPCVHPGWERATARPLVFRTMLLCTICVLLKTAQTAMLLIDQYPGLDRKALCEKIAEATDRELETSGFWHKYTEAYFEISAVFRSRMAERRRRVDSRWEDQKSMLRRFHIVVSRPSHPKGPEELTSLKEHLAALGVARGPPDAARDSLRWKQVQDLAKEGLKGIPIHPQWTSTQ